MPNTLIFKNVGQPRNNKISLDRVITLIFYGQDYDKVQQRTLKRETIVIHHIQNSDLVNSYCSSCLILFPGIQTVDMMVHL